MNEMPIEDEQDLNKIAETILNYASVPDVQRTCLKSALNLFYLKGHRNGYNEAMNDFTKGKDQRVVAHLN